MSDSVLSHPQSLDMARSLRVRGHRSAVFSIRSTQPEDLVIVANLLSNSFYGDQGFWPWLVPILKLGIYQDLHSRFHARHSKWTCLVGVQRNEAMQEIPGQFVGTVEIAVRPLSPWSPLGSVAYISNLAVAEHYRGQGVGKRLLMACERLARQWGQRDLYLHVLATNESARHLYTKVGYRVQHQEFQWSSWCMGQPQRILMHKHLQD